MKTRFFDKPTIILIGMLIALDLILMLIGPHDALDIRLYYTGDQARALFASFDEEQVQRYFVTEWIDLCLFITTYTTLLIVCMRKYWPRHQWLAFVPGFFDVLETASIVIALSTTGPYRFFDWLGIATFLKWTTGGALVIAIIWKATRPTEQR